MDYIRLDTARKSRIQFLFPYEIILNSYYETVSFRMPRANIAELPILTSLFSKP